MVNEEALATSESGSQARSFHWTLLLLVLDVKAFPLITLTALHFQRPRPPLLFSFFVCSDLCAILSQGRDTAFLRHYQVTSIIK